MSDKNYNPTLDRLYLEWSRHTGAKTARELELERQLAELQAKHDALVELMRTVRMELEM